MALMTASSRLKTLFAGAVSLVSLAAASPPPPVDEDAARAADAHADLEAGRFIEVANVLETLVAPRHHTLPIKAEWHRDLAAAYAGLGLDAAAQGQMRMAMALDPSISQDALEALVGDHAPASLVPDAMGPNGAKYYGLPWTLRTDGTIRFAYGFAVPSGLPEGSPSYMIATAAADCDAKKTKRLTAREYDEAGKQTNQWGPGEWEAPSNALGAHALAMVCARDPYFRVRRLKVIDGPAMVADYRARFAPRAVALTDEQRRQVHCAAQVELFMAEVAKDGEVSGPTWAINDWWSAQVEALDLDAVKAAKVELFSYDNAEPDASKAQRSACLQEAIDKGAVPGL